MSKKLYNFAYTDEEIKLATQLYADDFQLDNPIDLLVQMEYLDKARAILNKKEPEDTDVESDNGRKEKPEAAPIPIHVEILLVNGEFMMPLQSVISILSCYFAPSINVHQATNDFLSVILQTTKEKALG